MESPNAQSQLEAVNSPPVSGQGLAIVWPLPMIELRHSFYNDVGH
jgi:hypothetical protein